MGHRALGSQGLRVSTLGLGCSGMTSDYGLPDDVESVATLHRAIDLGVTLFDTSDAYGAGRNEELIAGAIKGRRERLVIASKFGNIRGPNGERGGTNGHPDYVPRACEASLKRLQTDCIDVYQLHWPVRGSYNFRQNWKYDPSGQDRDATVAHMIGVLEAMRMAVEAGKIRHFALSNETAWGTMMWCRLADQHGLPRPVSIQNEYSLLARLFDTDMAEVAANEGVGLLAFSPMAAGLLSGKYAPDLTPPGSRRSFTPELGGRITPRVWPAIDAYRAIAARHGMDAAQMGLAFTLTRPFLTSAILGATSMEQLETALGAADLTLSDEVLAEIAAAHKAHPMPF